MHTVSSAWDVFLFAHAGLGMETGTGYITPRRKSSKALVFDNDQQNSVLYLIARVGSRMGDSFKDELRKVDLNINEWHVCSALLHHTDLNLARLAITTSTKSKTLSRVVNGLIKRGYVFCEASSGGARASAITLTERGVDITERLLPLAQIHERIALTGFSGRAADLLRDMLRVLYDNLAPLDQRK